MKRFLELAKKMAEEDPWEFFGGIAMLAAASGWLLSAAINGSYITTLGG